MFCKYRIFCIILPIVFLFAVAGCDHQDRQTAKAVFHLNYSSGNLESTDPAFAKDLYTMWVVHMLYNTLFDTNDSLELIPSLARNYTVSPNGLHYTIHIRSGVRFHDHELFPAIRYLTADDVVYSFYRLIDPGTASPGAWIFNDKVRSENPFEAVDDTTLLIHLKTPFAPLPQLLSMPYCSIVPREVVAKFGKDFRRHPCGTGPFTFSTWDEGNHLSLHKNQHYWEKDQKGKSLPYLDAVTIGFVDSKAQEFLLFSQGKVDFINNIDGSFKDLVLRKDGSLKGEYADKFNLTYGTYLNTEYIGILTDTANALLQNSSLSNRLVRLAMNYAIDRRKIATYFKNGTVMPATGGFIPKGMPGHTDSIYYYSPSKALDLLAEAGFPGGRGLKEFSILTPDNYLDIVNFVVAQLKEVGIPARAEVMQPNLIRQQMSQSKALMFRAQWIADYPDAETYLIFFNGAAPAPPNYTRYSNQEFDRRYNNSMNLSYEERIVQYKIMDSIAMADAPLIPVFYDRRMHFTQKNIHGFESNPMNLIDLKYVIKE